MSTSDHVYQVELKWDHGVVGVLNSPELNSSIEVATPPNFKNGVEGIWSPEHLLVAAVSSCLMTTFVAIAGFSKLTYEALNVSASGKIGKENDRLKITEIELIATVEVKEAKDLKKAERILYKSEKACLISNSVSSEIIFKPIVSCQEVESE